MFKKYILLLFIGFCIGVLGGLGILALQNYVGELVIELLDDEIKSSLPKCHLETDEHHVSFIRLNAYVNNPRIVCDNKGEVLSFKQVRVKVSLAKIFDKTIILKRLVLDTGHSKGILPQSETYKFIDYLISENPDPNYKTSAIKVLLKELLVYSTSFNEWLTDSIVLNGQGLFLRVFQDKNKDFLIDTDVDNVAIFYKQKNHNKNNYNQNNYKLNDKINNKKNKIALGSLNLSILSPHDSYDVIIKNILLNSLGSKVAAKLDIREDNSFANGAWRGSFDNRFLDKSFSDYFTYNLKTNGVVKGDIDNIIIKGDVDLEYNKDILTQAFISKTPITIDKFLATLETGINLDGAYFKLKNISLTGDGINVSSIKDLIIDDDKFNTKLKFKIDELDYSSVKLKDVLGTVGIFGTPSDYKIKLESEINSIDGLAFKTPKQNLSLLYYNDELEFKINSKDYIQGEGKIKFNEDGKVFVENFYIDINKLPLQNINDKTYWFLTSNISLRGGLSPYTLKGSGTIGLTSKDFCGESALSGRASLENGKVLVSLSNPLKSIETNLNLNLNEEYESKFTLKLKDFNPNQYSPKVKCARLSADVEYFFNIKNMLKGNGKVDIPKTVLGCAPHDLLLKTPTTLPINNGILNIKPIVLRGQSSKNNITISGNVDFSKNIDMHLDGNFNVSSFADFAPFLDELSGQIITNINIKGPVSSPQIYGSAKITDGNVYLESSNISIQKLRGDFILKGFWVEIKEIVARINGGRAKASGNIDILNFEKSNAKIDFRKVDLYVDNNTSFVLSGNLDLLKGKFLPKLQGNIKIDSLEFVKNITLDAILGFIKDSVFFYEKNIQLNSKKQDDINIELDVNIKSDDNIRIKMDWVDALLGCDLSLTGLSKFPIITGNIQGSEGFFGLRNKKFLINHADIIFKKHASPVLDITGEAYLRNSAGDNSLVIVDITGDLNSPKVNLMSDAGLSQKEIFNLLASGEGFSNGALSDSNSQAFLYSISSFLSSPSISGLKNIFNSITSIDSLSITSKYNKRTGTSEPAIIAEKKLTDEIVISGESIVGGSAGSTKISTFYYLTQKAYIDTYFETASTSAVGIDLNYNVISSSNKLTDYSFEGNDNYSELKLRSVLYINERKVVSKEKVKEIRRNLKRFYIKQGYLNVRVKSRIRSVDNFVKKVVFIINEDKKFSIKDINISSEKIASKIKRAVSHFKGKAFSEDNRKEIQKIIINILKDEGYLSARISEDFVLTGKNKVIVNINIESFKKYVFEFKGSRVFSREDFLKTINFKERSYPFGLNVVQLLIEGMDRLYRENGYLLTTIDYELIKEDDTQTYIISVKDEDISKVSSVVLNGNEKLSTEKIYEKIKSIDKDNYKKFLNPKFAIEEDIIELENIIKKIYRDYGYTRVKVKHSLNILDNNDVSIVYNIKEGEKHYITNVAVNGLPEELKIKYTQKITVPRKLRLVEKIKSSLKNAGYLNYELIEKIDKETDSLTITIIPNEKVKVSDIKIIGNSKVEEFTILKNLKINKGDVYLEDKIIESKNALLKLGLFNKISFSLIDNKENNFEKTLLIEVEEKAFNNLDVGIGVNSEYGLHLLTRAANKSLFKDGKTISLGADLFYDNITHGSVSQGSADLRFIEPSVFGSNVGFSKDYRYQRFTTSTYEFDLSRYVDGVSIYMPFENDLSLYFGQNFSVESLDNVSQCAIIGNYDDGNYNLSFLVASLKYDKRDDMLNPTSGYAMSLEHKLASKLFLSDAEFHSLELHVNSIFPFWEDFNFSSNNIVGASFAYGDTSQVPIAHRYYLGGANSIRGYRENSLGRRGSDGAVIGGDVLFANNFELNYFILETFSIHSFLDVGNVFLRDEGVKLSDLKYSTGVGFRFNLPIGPIGFDFAVPLNKESYDDSFRVHFSIGAKF
ncbi:MAG: translocation/assembly module TamB domain-containing protein [Bdellovibrionota bacterium]